MGSGDHDRDFPFGRARNALTQQQNQQHATANKQAPTTEVLRSVPPGRDGDVIETIVLYLVLLFDLNGRLVMVHLHQQS